MNSIKVGLAIGALALEFTLLCTGAIRLEVFSRDYAVLFLLCYIIAQNIVYGSRDG